MPDIPQPSPAPSLPWVCVEGRLPDTGRYVIVWICHRDSWVVAKYHAPDNVWHVLDEDGYVVPAPFSVTHWLDVTPPSESEAKAGEGSKDDGE